MLVDRVVGFRVPAEAEDAGVDLAEHGESAYAFREHGRQATAPLAAMTGEELAECVSARVGGDRPCPRGDDQLGGQLIRRSASTLTLDQADDLPGLDRSYGTLDGERSALLCFLTRSFTRA